ncbi:diacylglycerol/lipid kinase family protein [Oceanibacterium hippocampi]|uniref:Diacylglycerol kinase n=1 Tax=Oceanibacterium hippocampi TaxID=745714 RepID=A0A1Y5S411_9PROT|nr:diacylglycerol kinase family protein [Oceanibacterium hippocampi]SLN32142.1 Diacylglycerol kinase [Oceanibacterium hippocampi]
MKETLFFHCGFPMPTLIIHNPTAGRSRRRRLDAFIDRLGRLGMATSLRQTGKAGDATIFAAGSTAGTVVAAGGDGTMNEVANGLAGSDARLAFMPLGTANVLAWEIGLGSSPERAAAVVAGDVEISVHAGLANGRRFLLMAGIGFDAWTVRAVDLRQKRLLGPLAYVIAMVRVLRRFPFPDYRVTVDGVAHAACSVIVCRGRCYGGPFVLAPAAGLEAGLLQVLLFERGGVGAVIRFGLALLTGRMATASGVRIIAGREIRIEGPAGDPVQLDGDLAGTLPLDIAIDERPLRLAVPAQRPAGNRRG